MSYPAQCALPLHAAGERSNHEQYAAPQYAENLREAYRLADRTGKPVLVRGYPYPIQPDYRSGFTTAT
jgi:hypothetical protein